ncbi:MgtC/SapB family protein [Homoserinibacter sp. GY 40078]|nr:MgtC/SapB family protein [Homoserinibacter sp. GY 40078]
MVVDLALRTLLALALGAVIGLERQWRLRTAGIRTNALVAVGSALFVIMGSTGFGTMAAADPTRVAAQVVSGIGFLGAGVILRDGANIRGLTTAATLWCAAAVGMLAGAGMTVMALIGAGAIVATNTGLRPLGMAINRHHGRDALPPHNDSLVAATDYVVEVSTTEKNELRMRAMVLHALDRPEFTLRSLNVRHGKNSRLVVVAGISAPERAGTAGLESLMQHISLDPKVSSTRWWASDNDD